VETLAKITVRGIGTEAAVAEDDAHRKELLRHAYSSESDHRLLAMIRLARSDLPVLPDELDRDQWLLNVENGTLDLRAGTIAPHDQGQLITKLAPVRFDESAACPAFNRFLERVLPDPSLRAFLKKVVGYSLTGITTEQVLFFLYGLGANGKTVLQELWSRMLGDYAAKADSSSLLVRRNEGPRNDLAALVGARLVAASEANEGSRLDEAVVKALTGGDRITARKLYAEPFTFQPTFKIVLAANTKPTIAGRGHAIWRRIRLIPFTETIPESERDPHLLERLSEELPGILAWAVEGCLAWQKEGLQAPSAVCAATEGYRSEMDSLAPFLEECCLLGAESEQSAGELYGAYQKWAETNHERPIGKTAFGNRLGEHGFQPRKGAQGRRGWLGLRLRQENEVARVARLERFPKSPHEEICQESPRNEHPARHPRHLQLAEEEIERQAIASGVAS
jgi:putative DNA primase/helicase